MAEKISVMSPLGYPPKVTIKPMAPRLEGLDGKTIYLVDPRFDDSGLFMEQLQVVTQRLPEDEDQARSRSTTSTAKDDPETWDEIKANGDAAIIGVGH